MTITWSSVRSTNLNLCLKEGYLPPGPTKIWTCQPLHLISARQHGVFFSWIIRTLRWKCITPPFAKFLTNVVPRKRGHKNWLITPSGITMQWRAPRTQIWASLEKNTRFNEDRDIFIAQNTKVTELIKNQNKLFQRNAWKYKCTNTVHVVKFYR